MEKNYTSPLVLLLLDSGGWRWPPDRRWDEVGWNMRWGWCCPTGSQGGGNQQQEWGLWRKGVEGDLQWGQVAELGALSGIGRPGGVQSTYPPWPDPWDEWDSWRGGPPCGRVERHSGQVLSSAQPTEWRWDWSLEQWPERSWERALLYDRGSSCSAWSIGGASHKTIFGCLGLDGLLYHPALEEVSGQGVSALFQHAPWRWGGGRWVHHLWLAGLWGCGGIRPGEGWGPGGSWQLGDWGVVVGGR